MKAPEAKQVGQRKVDLDVMLTSTQGGNRRTAWCWSLRESLVDGWSGEEGLLCPAPEGFTQHLEGGASPAAFSVPALATWPGEQESGMKEAMDMPLRVERSMPCRS